MTKSISHIEIDYNYHRFHTWITGLLLSSKIRYLIWPLHQGASWSSRVVRTLPVPTGMSCDMNNEIGVQKPSNRRQTVVPVERTLHGGFSAYAFATWYGISLGCPQSLEREANWFYESETSLLCLRFGSAWKV